MDLRKLEQELQNQPGLRAAAESPEGKALASRVDGSALAEAAKRGDTDALKAALRQILSTPEGRTLAEQVQKAVGKK